jgi:hypothetical protein
MDLADRTSRPFRVAPLCAAVCLLMATAGASAAPTSSAPTSTAPTAGPSLPGGVHRLEGFIDPEGLKRSRIQAPSFLRNKDGTPFRVGQDTDPLGKAPDFWRTLFVWRSALKPPPRPATLVPVGRLAPMVVPPSSPIQAAGSASAMPGPTAPSSP